MRIVPLPGTLSPDHLEMLLKIGVDAILPEGTTVAVLQRSVELVLLGQQLVPTTMVQVLVGVAVTDGAESTPSMPDIDVAPTTPILEVTNDNARSEPADKIVRDNGVAPSGHEHQVLLYPVEGDSSEMIADKLEITEATVKVHVKRLSRKIRSVKRTPAATWALDNQLGFGHGSGGRPVSELVARPWWREAPEVVELAAGCSSRARFGRRSAASRPTGLVVAPVET